MFLYFSKKKNICTKNFLIKKLNKKNKNKLDTLSLSAPPKITLYVHEYDPFLFLSLSNLTFEDKTMKRGEKRLGGKKKKTRHFLSSFSSPHSLSLISLLDNR